MAQKTRLENFRVSCQPRARWYGERTEKETRDLCAAIEASIRRHIDDVDNVGTEFDTVKECEHCGSQWTESGLIYNGGCCAKDEDCNPNPEPQEPA